jgi:hypothetical protein
LFVGRDGGADKLAQTTKQLQAQRAMFSQASAPLSAAKVALPLQQPRQQPSNEPVPELPLLEALPGSTADPAHPQLGDVFINPVTGQRFRVARREDAGKDQAAFPGQAYSSSAPSP